MKYKVSAAGSKTQWSIRTQRVFTYRSAGYGRLGSGGFRWGTQVRPCPMRGSDETGVSVDPCSQPIKRCNRKGSRGPWGKTQHKFIVSHDSGYGTGPITRGLTEKRIYVKGKNVKLSLCFSQRSITP